MKAKKPVKYIQCPKCKGQDFHYENLDGAKYRCNKCKAIVTP